MKIELDVRLSPFENAAKYYEKAKKLKQKLESLKLQIEETKKKLENVNLEIEKERKKLEKKRRVKWYEKFRWFFTSNNFLLVAGKDASSNEVLIRKYLEKNDLVFHADIKGSPFGILKNGKDANEVDIKEAAQFVASYSRAWKQKLGAIEVYYIYPDQVSKRAPAGEYLPRGSFMIYGEKNYVTMGLKVAIGVDQEGNVIPGVPSSVERKSKKYVILIPGDIRPSEIAKEISKFLEADLEDIQRFVPGEARIISKIDKLINAKL